MFIGLSRHLVTTATACTQRWTNLILIVRILIHHNEINNNIITSSTTSQQQQVRLQQQHLARVEKKHPSMLVWNFVIKFCRLLWKISIEKPRCYDTKSMLLLKFRHLLCLAVWSKCLVKFGNIWKTNLADCPPERARGSYEGLQSRALDEGS